MPFWLVFAFITAVFGAISIALALLGQGVAAGWIALGFAVGAVVWALIATLMNRGDAAAKRMDRAGPVQPVVAHPRGVAWTMDQFASALAARLSPYNGVVFADQRRGMMRVMLDPPAAIGRNVRMAPGRSVHSIAGTWYTLTARRGRIPLLQTVNGLVGARVNDAGHLLPVWRPGRGGDRQTTRALHQVGAAPIQRAPVLDDAAFTAIVAALALEAGWVDNPTAADPDAVLTHDALVRRRENLWIGGTALGVFALCVAITIAGLMNGMPGWASFVIVGGGLFFCLCFLVPMLVMRRSSGHLTTTAVSQAYSFGPWDEKR